MATGFDPKAGSSRDSDSEDEKTWEQSRKSPPYSKEDEEVAEMSRRGSELDDMLKKLRLHIPAYTEEDHLTPIPIPEEPKVQPGVPIKCSDRSPSATPRDDHVIPFRPRARNLKEAIDAVPVIRGGWKMQDTRAISKSPAKPEDSIWSFSDCFSANFLGSSIASTSPATPPSGTTPTSRSSAATNPKSRENVEDSGSSTKDPPGIDATPKKLSAGILVPVAIYADDENPDKRKKKLKSDGKKPPEDAKTSKKVLEGPISSANSAFSPIQMDTDSTDGSSESTDVASTGTCEYLVTPTNKNLLHGEDNMGFVSSSEASGDPPSGSAGASSSRTTPEDMDIDMDSPPPGTGGEQKSG